MRNIVIIIIISHIQASRRDEHYVTITEKNTFNDHCRFYGYLLNRNRYLPTIPY